MFLWTSKLFRGRPKTCGGDSDKTLGSCWDMNLHTESPSISISCNLKLNMGLLRVVNRTHSSNINRLTDVLVLKV